MSEIVSIISSGASLGLVGLLAFVLIRHFRGDDRVEKLHKDLNDAKDALHEAQALTKTFETENAKAGELIDELTKERERAQRALHESEAAFYELLAEGMRGPDGELDPRSERAAKLANMAFARIERLQKAADAAVKADRDREDGQGAGEVPPSTEEAPDPI